VHDFTPACDTAVCDDDRCTVVRVPKRSHPATKTPDRLLYGSSAN
jgi:hypothetical protein